MGGGAARAPKTRAPSLPVILLTGWEAQACQENDPGRLMDRAQKKPVRLEIPLQAITVLDEREFKGRT